MNQNKKSTTIANLEQPQAFDMLCRLKSKTVIYRGHQLEILEIAEEGTAKFSVLTTNGSIGVTLEKVTAFIAEAYPIDQIKPQAASLMPQSIEPANRQEGILDDMTEDLYEIFKHLKAKPTRENIEQATTMSNTANTIANMMKLKIQAAKLGKTK